MEAVGFAGSLETVEMENRDEGTARDPAHRPSFQPEGHRRGAVVLAGLRLLRVVLALLDAVLVRCWPLVAAVVVTAVFFAYVAQGREALYAAIESLFGGFWFYAASCLWGLLAMYLASLLLEDWGAPTGPVPRRYAAHFAPALIGMTAAFLGPVLLESYVNSHPVPGQRGAGLSVLDFLILFGGSLIPAARNFDGQKSQNEEWIVGFLIWNGLVFLVAWPFFESFGRAFLGCAALDVVFVAVVDGFTWRAVANPEVPWLRKAMGGVFAVITIIAVLYVAAHAATAGPTLGPGVVFLLVVSSWVGVAYLAVLGFRRCPRALVAPVLLGLGAALLTGPFHEEDVRTVDAPRADAGRRRLTISAHAREWLEARRDQILASGDEKYPVFLVTARGGGLRAAYWTAASLGALQDANPEFAGHVFGISGVSGGSVGAAVFVALVQQSKGKTPRGAGRLQALGSDVLAADFLSAPLAAMLTRDVARSLLRHEFLPGRGAVLEQAFEAAWHEAVGSNAFAGRFDDLWAGDEALQIPSLFLNCTDADTGQRLVVSNIALEGDLDPKGDVRALLDGRTVRLSTAALLSARFPVVSPAGVVRPVGGAPLRVVDGGYFDNSGAASAADALSGLLDAAKGLGLEGRLRYIAIVITNDPVLPENTSPVGSPATLPLMSVLSPVQTLDLVRQGLADRFEAELKHRLAAVGGAAVDVRLRSGAVDFPLGWMLSGSTRAAMDRQIQGAVGRNDGPLRRILDLLARRGRADLNTLPVGRAERGTIDGPGLLGLGSRPLSRSEIRIPILDVQPDSRGEGVLRARATSRRGRAGA
jgi:hypothetical protein